MVWTLQWGILDRFAVIGVIDQVDLVRIRPPTPAPDLSQNRGKMDYYLRSSAEKRRKKRKDPVIVQAPSHKVFISDSKTRFTRSIPTGNREGTSASAPSPDRLVCLTSGKRQTCS